jgi:hypothetical protein
MSNPSRDIGSRTYDLVNSAGMEQFPVQMVRRPVVAQIQANDVIALVKKTGRC